MDGYRAFAEHHAEQAGARDQRRRRRLHLEQPVQKSDAEADSQ
ncbi:hypothetical protein OKW43_000908 [Paraburkholderia sp. WC7.3g]